MSKTTNSKIRYKKLVDSVFQRNIYVVVGAAEDVAPFLHSKFSDSEDDVSNDNDGEFLVYESGQYVIWLEKFDESTHSYNILSHEVTHAVWTILTSVGLVFSEDSEEAFAFYAGSLTEQIVKFLRK